MIDSDSADDGNLHVGDTTTVRVPDPIEVTVVGIAELRSGESLGGVTYTWFDTDTAQRLLLHSDDLVSAVNLTAAPGVSPEQLVAAVQPTLPSGIEAVTGSTLTAEDDADIAADFLDFFETFLLMFAGVALLVSTFTIHNTFSIVVAQRTRESALLRALGASRRQVLTAVVIESLVVGIVASAIGLFSGLLLANGLHALLEALGLGIPDCGAGARQHDRHRVDGGRRGRDPDRRADAGGQGQPRGTVGGAARRRGRSLRCLDRARRARHAGDRAAASRWS